jgi:hypothetical protein
MILYYLLSTSSKFFSVVHDASGYRTTCKQSLEHNLADVNNSIKTALPPCQCLNWSEYAKLFIDA